MLDEQVRTLAELVARRRQLVEMIGMESDRRRQARSAKVLRGLERTLAALQAALAELDREIDGQVRGSPAWRAAEDLLTSEPGIGKITARTMIAELPSTAVGSPLWSASPRSTATAAPGVAIGQSPAAARRCVTCPVHGRLSTTSWNPAIRDLYLRLRQRGRPAKAVRPNPETPLTLRADHALARTWGNLLRRF